MAVPGLARPPRASEGAGAARGLRRAVLAALALLPLVVLSAVACTASTSSGTTSDVAGVARFADGEQLRYGIYDDQNTEVGIDVFTTRVEGDTYVLEQSYTESVPAGEQPTTDVVRLTVRRDTLKPLSGTREIDRRTDQGRSRESYDWEYATDDQGRPVLHTTHHAPDGKTEQRTTRLRDHYYDNESSLWLWRTLAFAQDYAEYYVSVNPIENSQQTVDLRIPLRQAADVPAGTFDTWRLLIRNGRAVRTAWVNAADPRQIVQWDNGTVVFRLLPPK